MLIGRYEELAIAWGDERAARRANKLFDQLHGIAGKLRDTDSGRRAVESLCTHQNRAVRLMAASNSLAWDCTEGERTLEALVTSGGRYSFEAEMTLRELRAGRLTFDWW